MYQRGEMKLCMMVRGVRVIERTCVNHGLGSRVVRPKQVDIKTLILSIGYDDAIVANMMGIGQKVGTVG